MTSQTDQNCIQHNASVTVAFARFAEDSDYFNPSAPHDSTCEEAAAQSMTSYERLMGTPAGSLWEIRLKAKAMLQRRGSPKKDGSFELDELDNYDDAQHVSLLLSDIARLV